MFLFKMALNGRHYLLQKGEESNRMNQQLKVFLRIFTEAQNNVCQANGGFSWN